MEINWLEVLLRGLIGLLAGASFGIVLYIDGARRWGWRWLWDEIKKNGWWR